MIQIPVFRRYSTASPGIPIWHTHTHTHTHDVQIHAAPALPDSRTCFALSSAPRSLGHPCRHSRPACAFVQVAAPDPPAPRRHCRQCERPCGGTPARRVARFLPLVLWAPDRPWHCAAYGPPVGRFGPRLGSVHSRVGRYSGIAGASAQSPGLWIMYYWLYPQACLRRVAQDCHLRTVDWYRHGALRHLQDGDWGYRSRVCYQCHLERLSDTLSCFSYHFFFLFWYSCKYIYIYV